MTGWADPASTPMDDLLDAFRLAEDLYRNRYRLEGWTPMFFNRQEWEWLSAGLGGDQAVQDTLDEMARAHGFVGVNVSIWLYPWEDEDE